MTFKGKISRPAPFVPYAGQFPQDGNLALRVSFFWFTFERSCIHKFAPKHFLTVQDQNSGLLYPKNVKKSFENAQKTPKKRPF